MHRIYIQPRIVRDCKGVYRCFLVQTHTNHDCSLLCWALRGRLRESYYVITVESDVVGFMVWELWMAIITCSSPTSPRWMGRRMVCAFGGIFV